MRQPLIRGHPHPIRIRTPNTPPFAAARLQHYARSTCVWRRMDCTHTTDIAALIHRAVRPQALNIRSPFAPTNSIDGRASREEVDAGFIKAQHHCRRFPSPIDDRLPVDPVRDEQRQEMRCIVHAGVFCNVNTSTEALRCSISDDIVCSADA